MNSKQSIFKQSLDQFLIIDFFLVIGGGLFFLIAVICSANGLNAPYQLFQKLWVPLFVPAISLFFTAVFFEALWIRLNQDKT